MEKKGICNGWEIHWKIIYSNLPIESYKLPVSKEVLPRLNGSSVHQHFRLVIWIFWSGIVNYDVAIFRSYQACPINTFKKMGIFYSSQSSLHPHRSKTNLGITFIHFFKFTQSFTIWLSFLNYLQKIYKFETILLN